MPTSLVIAVLTVAPFEPQEPAATPPQEEAGGRNLTVVVGKREELLGAAEAGSQGYVGGERLGARPLLRPGEVLETVPGLVVTQHSGPGKANQFFLRGYNLDHGTDFLTLFEGVPINWPTHAHGQGYTDVNFLIPELVEGIDYRKGPYFSRLGDFASTGASDIHYVRELPEGLLRLQAGSYDSYRALAADSFRTEEGDTVLYGLELSGADGPWTHPDDAKKQNGMLRWSRGTRAEGASVSLLAYDASWNSTDQIPRRAVEADLLGRFDAVDPTDGGRTSRFLLSADWSARHGANKDRVAVWGQYYELDLFSNFTYFLDDPVNGDQFLQSDQRVAFGAELSREQPVEVLGLDAEATYGVQLRNDEIHDGLFHTRARRILSTTREDDVRQTSAGAFAELFLPLAERVRMTAGLRGDFYRFHVVSDDADNSGTETDAIASPKLSLVFGPWSRTELYLDGGLGFHSNDGRGVLTTDDPTTPTPGDGDPVDPLVRTKGAEIGIRTLEVEGLESTLALWVLESDSEILFVGDAGTTEPSRPSRRIGVESANLYAPLSWLTLDLDASLSHARFTDDDPSGHEIPGSIESVVSAGATVGSEDGWYASLRYRFFGPRPLVEDGSVDSRSSNLFNLAVGRRVSRHLSFDIEILNLFDDEVDDIAYFYGSRLQGEPPEGVDDVHFHPAEPLTLRIGMSLHY